MSYDASSIKVLKGLEAVRKRPAMYIGDIGKRGYHHLFYEVLDNAVDESIAGFADKITVILHKDGMLEVRDNGRGIPVDIHPEFKKSALELVVTTLHAGGKFDKKAYKISGGLHGVGISVVCALSEYMEITVKRDGKIYRQKYSRGKALSEVEIIGETEETGTEVKFKPDHEIFTWEGFDPDVIEERIQELSFLNKNIAFIFKNEITGEEKSFRYEKGIMEFVRYLSSGSKMISEVMYGSGENNLIKVEFSFAYTDTYHEKLYSYVNNIRTEEGGTHVSGFKSALTRAINDFIKSTGLLKDGKRVRGEDVSEGLTAVISVLHPDPQFEGQTKTKLGNSEVKGIVESIAFSSIKEWFEINKDHAKLIARKVISNMEAREAAKRVKDSLRRKTVFESSLLPGKLSDCSTKELEKSELFIVEGDSAGGSAKQARDREFQAILPLKGKILNVEKANMEKLLRNEEIRSIILAIGTDIGDSFDYSKLRYGKIIIMTDADVDGSHIRTLLLTLFFRYFRPLIEKGHIYIARPPLYKITKGKNVYYAYSDEELEQIKKTVGTNVSVQRYKGLGEMNPEQLWETTMDPEKRVLKLVTIEDAIKADELFSILLGENVEVRREFIEKHALEVKELDV